jgi:hypothetical protein
MVRARARNDFRRRVHQDCSAQGAHHRYLRATSAGNSGRQPILGNRTDRRAQNHPDFAMGCLLGLSCCERVTIPTKAEPLGVGVLALSRAKAVLRSAGDPRFSYHAARLSCPLSQPPNLWTGSNLSRDAGRTIRVLAADLRLLVHRPSVLLAHLALAASSSPAAVFAMGGSARRSLFEERVDYQNSSARTFRASRSSTALTIPVSVLSTNAWATSTYSETTTRAGTSVRFSSS